MRPSLPNTLLLASVPKAQLLIQTTKNANVPIKMPSIPDFRASARQAIFRKSRTAFNAPIHVFNAQQITSVTNAMKATNSLITLANQFH